MEETLLIVECFFGTDWLNHPPAAIMMKAGRFARLCPSQSWCDGQGEAIWNMTALQ